MSGGASISRDVQRLVKGATAQLAGRDRRGPDKKVHRNSYDVDDPNAKPFAPVLDGSAAAGLAKSEALVDSARELRLQQRTEFPAAVIREKRRELAAAEAELAELEERSPAEVPIGRPATLRQMIVQTRAFLARADLRLRAYDILILQALLSFLNFRTGELFPEHESIAKVAGCCRNRVMVGLKRLREHGFVFSVRRSKKTGNDGVFAPQREQTSCAYGFDHRRQMASRTWHRFMQKLEKKLKRLGRKAEPDASRTPEPPAPGSMAEYIASLGAAVERACPQ